MILNNDQVERTMQEKAAVRIALIEHALLAIEKEKDLLRTDVSSLRADIRALATSIQELDNKLSRYTGFWGGILLMFGSVGAVMGLLFSYMRQ